ncbi:MAG TPA: DUF2089 family protein [Armatimonadota bacterium]
MPALVSRCPSCGGVLEAERLGCPQCHISLEGHFELGVLERLAPAERDFVVEFVKASGSLKDMARRLQVSYPTVRSRLDELIARIEELEVATQSVGGEQL